MIRTKGEAGTGDIVNAVTHMRAVFGAIRTAAGTARGRATRRQGAPGALRARALGRGERAPPGRHLHGGRDRDARGRVALHAARRGRVFVGSGIFKSGDPVVRAKAIVEATTHFDDPKVLADVSAGLGQPMVGISASSLCEEEARGPRLVAATAMDMGPRIGVLALQGAFREHANVLRELGADVYGVRSRRSSRASTGS